MRGTIYKATLVFMWIFQVKSPKHLQRYVDEFARRYNTRDMDFSEVFTGMVNCAADGSPLTYKALIQ